MNLHEYQAKRLLREAAIPVPQGEVIDSPSAAIEAARRLGGGEWVLKAQIHAGQRASSGGVRLVKGLKEISPIVNSLLGERLVTPENAPTGQPVNHLLIEIPFSVEHAYYLDLTLDTYCGRMVFNAAPIAYSEYMAETVPEMLHRIEIDPACGLQPFQCRSLAVKLGIPSSVWRQFSQLINSIYQLFIDCDFRRIVLSPLAMDKEGEFMVLDAKIQIDDNALSRQQALKQLEDLSQDDFQQKHRDSNGLNFISLGGDICCVVNGSGLALATLDLIHTKGGAVSNMIDVGDGATAEELSRSFRLLWGTSRTRVVLVNVVGGIVRCNVVAAGIIDALVQQDIHCPLVVRLEGSGAKEGRELFEESGLSVNMVTDVDNAIKAAVDSVRY